MRVTFENLKDVLHYDPESGAFWYKETCGTRKRGTRVGSTRSDGYVAIRVDGKKRGAQRLAWFYMYGEHPKGVIDHINGVRDDNRISNLRDVTKLLNRHNWQKTHARGKNSRCSLRATHKITEWKPEKFGEELTQDFVQTMFDYNPDTGIFTGKKARATNNVVGSIAGKAHSVSGYTYINTSLGGRKYHFLAHRLAWLYVHGRLPKEQIDHINGVRGDNRLLNLREVTDAQNKMNVWSKKNKTGYSGVYKDKKKWGSTINISYKRVHLGTFNTPEEAHKAYKYAKKKYHGEFARAV